MESNKKKMKIKDVIKLMNLMDKDSMSKGQDGNWNSWNNIGGDKGLTTEEVLDYYCDNVIYFKEI